MAFSLKANQLGLHDNGQLITCGEGSLRVKTFSR